VARIAGVDLPRNKRIEVGLTYVFGIGRSLSAKILKQVNVDPNKKTDQLGDDEVGRIRDHIEKNVPVEDELFLRISRDSWNCRLTGAYDTEKISRYEAREPTPMLALEKVLEKQSP